MNVSGNTSSPDDETDSWKIYFALGVLLLVITVAGLVTNVLSTVVWMTQSRGNPAALFIGCLSFTDALFCLAILVFSLIIILTLKEEMVLSVCLYYMAKEVIFISANASRLLCVALTAQRWLAVSKPLLMTRLFTLQRQNIVLTCLSLPIIAILSFDIYVIWMDEIDCQHNDFEDRMGHFLQAYRILNFAFPVLCFVCMFVFNGALLFSACRVRQVTSSLTSSLTSRHLQRELRMTLTILCVSALAMVECCLSIIVILDILGFELDGVHRKKVLIVFMFVVLVLRPVTFVIYSCMGKEFRIKLKSMCTCKRSSTS